MQTKYGVSAVVVVAAANFDESATAGDSETVGSRRYWRVGTSPFTFGDIVLCTCAVVGTLIVVLDAWSSCT